MEGPQAKTPTDFSVGHSGAGSVQPVAAQVASMGQRRRNNGRSPVEAAVKTIALSTRLSPPTPTPLMLEIIACLINKFVA